MYNQIYSKLRTNFVFAVVMRGSVDVFVVSVVDVHILDVGVGNVELRLIYDAIKRISQRVTVKMPKCGDSWVVLLDVVYMMCVLDLDGLGSVHWDHDGVDLEGLPTVSTLGKAVSKEEEVQLLIIIVGFRS